MLKEFFYRPMEYRNYLLERVFEQDPALHAKNVAVSLCIQRPFPRLYTGRSPVSVSIKNRLDTGTLGFTDIRSSAEYKVEH